VYQLHVFISYN